jgi:hypothetical protein
MKIEKGFQPNCSEVVFNIQDMTIEEVRKIMGQHGIEEIEIEGFYSHDDEPRKLIADVDNPNMPDISHHATLELREDYQACGNYQGINFVGHQHCQHQLFPTMKKIEGIFGGEWMGDDGGSTTGYEEWRDCNKRPPKNYQDKIIIYLQTGKGFESRKEKIIQYAATLGTKLAKEKDLPDHALCFKVESIPCDFGKFPGVVGKKLEVIGIAKIRNDINKFAESLMEEK